MPGVILTDTGREALEVVLAFVEVRDPSMGDKELSVSVEYATVFPICLGGHVGCCGSSLDKGLKVTNSVVTVLVEVGVAGVDLLLEEFPGGLDTFLSHARDIGPRLAFSTSIAHGPLDNLTVGELCSVSQRLNVAEEVVKS